MANMSYCRFRNTLSDLKDCYESMDAGNLDEDEEKARLKMIKLCLRIANEYEQKATKYMQWKCYAHPPMLNGKPCGHVNAAGVIDGGILCCEKCTCTKFASDVRQKRFEEENQLTPWNTQLNG